MADRPHRVLYCTIVPIGSTDNGGSLVCRQHVERLAELEGVELTVCTLLPLSHQVAAAEFVRQVGAAHVGIDQNPRGSSSVVRRLSRWRPSVRWPFFLEHGAATQSSLSYRLLDIDKQLRPDVVVLDYLFTALFAPTLVSTAERLVVITLNREAEFQAAMRRLRTNISESRISLWRLRWFERSVYSVSDAVVALSEGDVPPLLAGGSRARVIEPVLDASAARWKCSLVNSLLYIGNTDHYPNFLAIQWLCEKFAPQLAAFSPSARVRIIGATAEGVEPAWRRDNVDFLGVGDRDLVVQELTSASMFIAPIENNFGAKIKILDCFSHGTPVIATREALSGIPFPTAIPQFTLTNPEGAARLAASLLAENKAALLRLADRMQSAQLELLTSSRRKWREFLDDMVARPPDTRRRWRRSWWSWGPRSRVRLRIHHPTEVGVELHPAVSTAGFHGIEPFEGQKLRWTNGCAQMNIYLDERKPPRELRFALWNLAVLAEKSFSIFVNGELRHVGLIEPGATTGSIALQRSNPGAPLVVEIASPLTQLRAETRQLGVAIKSIMLYP